MEVYNFNPRSREGSDSFYEFTQWQTGISIHAPAKGATVNDVEKVKGAQISIHAPAKGATTDGNSR